jgi:hypothetical protein
MISPAWALVSLLLITLYVGAMVYLQQTLEAFENTPSTPPVDPKLTQLSQQVQVVHNALCPLLKEVQKELAKNMKTTQGTPTDEDLGKAFGRMVLEARKPLYQFCPSYQNIQLMPANFKTRILDTTSYLLTKLQSLNQQIETSLKGELKDTDPNNQDDPDANMDPMQKAIREAEYKASAQTLAQERTAPNFNQAELLSFYDLRLENVRQLMNQQTEGGQPLFNQRIQQIQQQLGKLREFKRQAESGTLQPNL